MDADNYFNTSKGVFRIQPASWADAAYNALQKGWFGKFEGQTDLTLGNRKWVPNYISESSRGSLSAYWISENGQWLLRLSNHWSDADRGIKTTKCGWIRNCWWELRGRRQPAYDNKPFTLGIIKLSDLTEI